MARNFVDCSNHQSTIRLDRIQSDGFIFKATEGRGWRDRSMPGFVAQARQLGKPIGFYHYISQGNTPQQEARNLLDYTAPYRRPGDILVNDWEPIGSNPGPSNTGWAREFNAAVRAGAPGNPLWIYMNLSTANGHQWGDVARDVPLWLAHFPGSNRANGYNPDGSRGRVSDQWRNVIAWQFTDRGRLSGYNGNLDLNIGYGWPNGDSGSSGETIVKVPEIPPLRENDPPVYFYHHHGGRVNRSNGQPRLACVCMAYTFPLIEKEMLKRGLIRHQIDCFQGAYNKGVKASAGTHDMGGVIDVAQGITLDQRRVWADFGVMMFPRIPQYNWTGGDHGHGVWHGCPHQTVSADRQVTSGMNGYDGLVGNRRRNFEAPTRVWQDAYREHAAETITIKPQEDAVPDVYRTVTEFDHAGVGPDGNGWALPPVKALEATDVPVAGDAHAVIHFPDDVKVVTRWVSWSGREDPGWVRDPETEHGTSKAETEADVDQAWAGADMQLDIWADKPCRIWVQQTMKTWPKKG